MKQELLEQLEPIVEFLVGLNPSDADAARTLDQRFPVIGVDMRALAALCEQGVEAGWLCDRDGGAGIRYSRVAKSIGPGEFSVDAVSMNGPGPAHTHPNGEFDLCFSVDGDPRFDGHSAGWAVYAPDSWHVPTVRGGRMNILYFLPGGAIKFGPRADL